MGARGQFRGQLELAPISKFNEGVGPQRGWLLTTMEIKLFKLEGVNIDVYNVSPPAHMKSCDCSWTLHYL